MSPSSRPARPTSPSTPTTRPTASPTCSTTRAPCCVLTAADTVDLLPGGLPALVLDDPGVRERSPAGPPPTWPTPTGPRRCLYAPRVRHLHLRLHRPPQGRADPPRRHREPPRVDAGQASAAAPATASCRSRRPASTSPSGSSSGPCWSARPWWSPTGGPRDPAYLVEVIRAQRVTTLQFVPSMLAVFLAEPTASTCTTLHTVILGGEAASLELAAQFRETLDSGLFNPTVPPRRHRRHPLRGPPRARGPERADRRARVEHPAYVLDRAAAGAGGRARRAVHRRRAAGPRLPGRPG